MCWRFRGDVDARRAGVWGHSQGGFIAPMVAAGNTDVRWIVDADGNVGPQYEQDLYRVETRVLRLATGDILRKAYARTSVHPGTIALVF
jgi:hypothetical protein